MHTIYVADDGTQFDYEWDCEIYEAQQTFAGKQYPILVNERGDNISIEDILNDDKKVNAVHYIFAHTKEELKNLYELFIWFGYAYSKAWKHSTTNRSSWVWSDHRSCWVNLDEKIAHYEVLKAIRDTYLKGE